MKDTTIERIEDYLEGRMDKPEESDFEKELESNPELAEHYKLSKEIDTFIRNENRREFKELVMQAWDKNNEKRLRVEKAKKRLLSPRNQFIAAAFIILSLSIFLVVNSRKRTSHSYLFKNHFAHYGYTIEPRGAGDSIGSFYNGMRLYEAGSFEDAISSFIDTEQNYNQISNFYIGLCYLELDQYKNAIIYLQKATAINGEQTQEAEWYLALAYLAEGKIKQTEGLLIQIINSQEHYYQQQAQNLLDDLEDL